MSYHKIGNKDWANKSRNQYAEKVVEMKKKSSKYINQLADEQVKDWQENNDEEYEAIPSKHEFDYYHESDMGAEEKPINDMHEADRILSEQDNEQEYDENGEPIEEYEYDDHDEL